MPSERYTDVPDLSAAGYLLCLPGRSYRRNTGQKQQKRTQNRTKNPFYYLLWKRVFLQKRENRGLLANLWEFPNCLGRLTLKQIREEVQSMGIKPARIQKCGTAKHIFTHVEWHMQGYLIEAENRGNGIGKWAAPEDIRKSFALPSAFQAFSKKLDEIIR